MIARCGEADFEAIYEIVNDGATAFRGVIPADRWHEPYMPREELREEIGAGVQFWGFREKARLLGVMGLQQVRDAWLIRHAYTRSALRGRGIGAALLERLKREAGRPLMLGTWKQASWAVAFYAKRGFALVAEAEKAPLLRRYWGVSERQIEESVVMALESAQ